MFKQFHKHGLIFCLILLAQLLFVPQSNAQDENPLPQPVRVDDELSLIPASVARMAAPPNPIFNELAGAAVITPVLPDIVDINTRRDAGSQLIPGLQTQAINELTIEATHLIPATIVNLTLKEDGTKDDPFDNLNDGTTHFELIEVTEDAVRLVAEIVDSTASEVQLFVGHGEQPDASTVVCSTAGTTDDYCNIPAPNDGAWWILVQNFTASTMETDAITLSQAVVAPRDSLCHFGDGDCFAAFEHCMANGGSLDSCWQALEDCLPPGLLAAAVVELKACFGLGWDDDCLDDWEDCFPGFDDLDALQNFDDDDCEDDESGAGNCECEAWHDGNHHEDDHFWYREHCGWWEPLLPNMWVEGPTTVAEMTPFDLRVFWDEPVMVEGELWYAAFDIGSDPQHPGDIGTVYVDLNRFEDDVVKTVSSATAVPGDTLTYTISVRPNVTPEDPTYVMTDTIPVGLTYVPGSATATGGTVAVTDNILTWTGPTRVPGYTYTIDTSETNPTCSAPSAGADGVADNYLDLAGLGIAPDPIIFGDSVWYQSTFTGGEFYLFGSPQGSTLNFTDDGFVFLKDSGPGSAPQAHQPIPMAGDPNNLLAVLWRDMEIVYDGTRGVTLATLVSASLGREVGVILEYTGVADRATPGSTATYDFELIAYYDVEPDRYEYIFAYNNLSDSVTLGTIGVENVLGTEGVQFGHDDLSLTSGMAICFDQVGNGETDVEITYQVTVDEQAFGTLTNQVRHITDNLGSKEAVASVDVTVAGAFLYLSSKSDGLTEAVDYADEDIVRYDLDTGEWSLFFDGSDVGLKGTDVDALHLLDDGSILLSLSHQLKIPDFGKVDDSDILHFIPKSLGEDSNGRFELYFDGSEYGLKRSGEDVDAIGFAPDGRLVVSTQSTFKVPKTNWLDFSCWDDLDAAMNFSWLPTQCNRLWGADEDLIVLNQDSGDWELYFDGSDVVGHRADIGGVWINPLNSHIYLSLQKSFQIDNLSGDALDIMVCRPSSWGSDTDCFIQNDLFFDGSQKGFGGYGIDGFAIGH